MEERDGSNVVTKRFYSQGIQMNGSSFFCTRDHLGSIRELTDSTSAVRARYDYDPYGNTTKLSGDLDVDFGYTGHYRHATSNLYLAPYRVYDPDLGRWLNRDPLENAELADGPNLYAYVGSNSLNWVDPLGLVSEKGEAFPPVGPFRSASGCLYECRFSGSPPDDALPPSDRPGQPWMLAACVVRAVAEMKARAAIDDDTGFDLACQMFADCINNYYFR